MRPEVSVAQWPSDILELRFVRISDAQEVGSTAR
jgi:hypothetical protein